MELQGRVAEQLVPKKESPGDRSPGHRSFESGFFPWERGSYSYFCVSQVRDQFYSFASSHASDAADTVDT